MCIRDSAERFEEMINKRLMHIMGKSKKDMWSQVFFQWISLLCNIVLMSGISLFLSQLSAGSTPGLWKNAIWILLTALAIRYVCTVLASRVSHYAAKQVKERLRTMIYEKLLRLGLAYQQKARTSEVVQLAVEGVDQLEAVSYTHLDVYKRQKTDGKELTTALKMIQATVTGSMTG